MTFGNRGTLFQLGNAMQVKNALVEEVSVTDNGAGYIIISYADGSANGAESLQYLRLNVNNNTGIINLTGGCNCLSDIQEGMWVDAIFSPQMTRSIPPQSNAFLILARRGLPASTETTTARILNISDHAILAGNPRNMHNQTLFLVTEHTVVRNRMGNPISLSGLRPGQMIRVTHSNAQTAGIPPQTAAFFIQVL